MFYHFITLAEEIRQDEGETKEKKKERQQATSI